MILRKEEIYRAASRDLYLSRLHDLFKFWEMSDDMSETVQIFIRR